MKFRTFFIAHLAVLLFIGLWGFCVSRVEPFDLEDEYRKAQIQGGVTSSGTVFVNRDAQDTGLGWIL